MDRHKSNNDKSLDELELVLFFVWLVQVYIILQWVTI